MTRDNNRAELGRELCGHLVARLQRDLGNDVIQGVWADPEALAVVAQPDVDFIVALFAWERLDTPTTYQAVVDTYEQLMQAWASAAQLYRSRRAAR